VHRTGELYGQFQTLEQQKESATLGMWVFLITEILFFGGLFMAYTVNRHAFPTAFGVSGNMLDLNLGFFNTIVLIASSFTMAMSVWSAQTSRRKAVPAWLIATLILGSAFLGIKVVEYKQKFDHHLIPGYHFDITYCSNNPVACGLSGKSWTTKRRKLRKASKRKRTKRKSEASPTPRKSV
jgi:heme/copper-type cytochrome/quinol oxidase subunit 3